MGKGVGEGSRRSNSPQFGKEPCVEGTEGEDMTETRLKKTAGRGAALIGLGAVMTVAALVVGTVAVGAVEYGNPDYLGILKAQPPTGFPVSPAALDLSKGP